MYSIKMKLVIAYFHQENYNTLTRKNNQICQFFSHNDVYNDIKI